MQSPDSKSTPHRARYGAFLRYAHWITAALVVLAYVAIVERKFLERGSPERLFVVQSHYLLGIVILLFTLPRILVRLRSTAPAITPPEGMAARIAAATAHLALFAFLVVQPLLGIVSRMAAGPGIELPLGHLVIPSLLNHDPALAKSVQHLHVWLGTAFYYVIGLHVVAALWHWLGRRDDTMQRML